mmetsp:Transcript_73579/g.204462  ORF Transcript_73579/g.204462 Transcript_73579/m.204462 type:complete len:255 (-) Transcript_73579:1366-2130(-)
MEGRSSGKRRRPPSLCRGLQDLRFHQGRRGKKVDLHRVASEGEAGFPHRRVQRLEGRPPVERLWLRSLDGRPPRQARWILAHTAPLPSAHQDPGGEWGVVRPRPRVDQACVPGPYHQPFQRCFLGAAERRTVYVPEPAACAAKRFESLRGARRHGLDRASRSYVPRVQGQCLAAHQAPRVQRCPANGCGGARALRFIRVPRDKFLCPVEPQRKSGRAQGDDRRCARPRAHRVDGPRARALLVQSDRWNCRHGRD